MTYHEILKSRCWERMPFAQYLECWRSVPSDVVTKVQHINWDRKIRIPFMLIDLKAFAVTWFQATPEERERMREEVTAYKI